MALELFVQLLEICGIINVNYRLSFYFLFPQIAYHSLTFYRSWIMELNTPNVRDDPMPSDIDDLLGPDDDNRTSSDHGKGQMEEKLGRSGASASAGAASRRIPTGGAFQSGSTP